MRFPALLRRHYFPDDRARVAMVREPHQNPIRQHRHEFLELAIEDHLTESISVPRLATQAGMSVRSLHRQFRAAIGQTPQEYATKQRMVRAKELLAGGTSARIAEIAAQCGFEGSNYFSRLFRAKPK